MTQLNQENIKDKESRGKEGMKDKEGWSKGDKNKGERGKSGCGC